MTQHVVNKPKKKMGSATSRPRIPTAARRNAHISAPPAVMAALSPPSAFASRPRPAAPAAPSSAGDLVFSLAPAPTKQCVASPEVDQLKEPLSEII